MANSEFEEVYRMVKDGEHKNLLDFLLIPRKHELKLSEPGGRSALRLAIEKNDYHIAQMLIVFGADVNEKSLDGGSLRHLAATSKNKITNAYILYLLHGVGAQRCSSETTGCKDGCKACVTGCAHAYDNNGTWKPADRGWIQTITDGVAFSWTYITERVFGWYHRKAIDEPDRAKWSRDGRGYHFYEIHDSKDESSQLPEFISSLFGDEPTSEKRERVLCLDGGGIRGLATVELLMAIEEEVNRGRRKDNQKSIKECFDYIGGTSTGGILALAILRGIPLREIRQMYFDMKDQVFAGSRPYNSETIEKFMKKHFGEKTFLDDPDYRHPRVVVTSVQADSRPVTLHAFKNFGKSSETDVVDGPDTEDQRRWWYAARSTSAAPTYFHPMGPFLDGGLMANNPTLDTLTEIYKFSHKIKPTIVVSLGTGRELRQWAPIPHPKLPSLEDIFKFHGIRSAVSVAEFSAELAELTTQAEGQVVERAKAWCGMVGASYFRLNPLVMPKVGLDCTDNKELLRLLWQTKQFIYRHRRAVSLLAARL